MRYSAKTEVHVFALSVAASVLLSFYPFLIVMVSLCKYAFHWPAAVNAIYFTLNNYLPGEVGQFIGRNLAVTVASRGPAQFVSVLLLLFTANGIFEPLEVALNRVWGGVENRSYLKNQLLSLGLILLCGGLVLGSFLLTALNQEYLKGAFGVTGLPAWAAWLIFKAAALPIMILALFLIYWLLPNCRVPAGPVARVAFVVGVCLELLKYLNIACWPFLKVKLQQEYGPFYISVSIVLLSFALAMIVLAGAEWSARRPAMIPEETEPIDSLDDQKLETHSSR
ncbi:MAG: ribonuclease [Bryobacterales bacterium]|nr:ribonuclease [Bryobacterales bacterium]